MRGRTLVTTGATPLLAVVLGAVGLTARLASLDYVLTSALILCLALIALGLYRNRMRKS